MTTTRAAFDDHMTLYEEWTARYRKVEKAVENCFEEDHAIPHRLYVASIAVRAGRLGSIQGALLDEQDGEGENRNMASPVEALLECTRLEIDQDACSQGLLRAADRLCMNTQCNNLSPNRCDTHRQSFRVGIDSSADEFFTEYPELMQVDLGNPSVVDGDSESCSEPDPQRGELGSTSQAPITKANKRRGDTRLSQKGSSESTRCGAYQAGHTSITQYIASSANDSSRPGRQKAEPNKEESATFSYSPTFQSASACSSSLQHSDHTGSVPHGATLGTHDSSFPRDPPRTHISKDAAWEDHRNQQNPFQTAREFAQSYSGSRRATVDSTGSIPEDVPHSIHRCQIETKDEHTGRDHQAMIPENYSNSCAIRNPYNRVEAISKRHNIPDSLKRKFQPPKRMNKVAGDTSTGNQSSSSVSAKNKGGGAGVTGEAQGGSCTQDDSEELPEELRHLDKELVKKIENEILESGETITFDQIAGLEDAKQTVFESVCWPMQRPDIYVGLRRPPTGILLFGPPGTGKTLIGKAIAHESKAIFFAISSSSLTSKWIGEGEKLVRTLFAVAQYRKPAVIFIDEIDSLLTQRQANENEASRRMKTEFLVQIDGAGTCTDGHVLTIGATNRPDELDEAVRRRFTKRLYIPLPDTKGRLVLMQVLLAKTNTPHSLSDEEFETLARETEGYSGADLRNLCSDAAHWPVRGLGMKTLDIDVKDIAPVAFRHFRKSLKGIKPTVASSDVERYEEWDKMFGTRLVVPGDDSGDDT